MGKLSFRKIILLIIMGFLLSSLLVSGIIFWKIKDRSILISNFILIIVFMFWGFLLIVLFQKKLVDFTNNITDAIDKMVSKNYVNSEIAEEESLFSRIIYRLNRLYNMLYENKRKIDREKSELESLITDISHQIKIPASNLKMINDTLLNSKLERNREIEFLKASNEQIEKLDFLIKSMIKVSRLETGIIKLVKNPSYLYETIVSALNGVLFLMEEKEIEFSLNCDENLVVPYDEKWTREAIFNVLDNAVKYTDKNGNISVNVEVLELYTKISIEDTGMGISESEFSNIFKRFYREEKVNNVDGVGIGLYLTREIIMKQGGYVKVESRLGKGTIFFIYLLNK